MKILLITSELPPQPGGIGNHAHELAKYLSRSYQVTVLADQRSEEGLEEQAFDDKQNYSVLRIKRKAAIAVTYLKRLFVAFEQSKQYDLTLVSGKFPLWVGGMLSKTSKKPTLAIIHGSEVQLSHPKAKQLTNWALKNMQHVTAVSHFTLKLVEDLNLKSTSVIPNGFNLTEEYTETKVEKSITDETLQLITVGNLTQRKGQHNVIMVLPKLLETFPKLIYHCVGIPTHKNQLVELANELGVEQNVKFHGRVSEEEKFKLLKQADIFMMLSEQTSTGDVEGFGIAILEANAVGLPAVGSNNCGIEDAIKFGYSGQLVNPHDSSQIISAVQDIIKNQNRFRKQAKDWSTHFTWDKIGAKYVEVIQNYV